MQKISSETFLRLFLASHLFHCILKCSLLREISDPPHLSQASILNPAGDLITGPELIKPLYPSLVVVSKAIWPAADPKSKSKSKSKSNVPPFLLLSVVKHCNSSMLPHYHVLHSHYTITQHFLVFTHFACLHNKYLCDIQGI